MRDLRGKVAVVTGAGSGIGAALSERLAEEGCSLAMVDIHGERLRAAAAEARSRGAQVSTHVVDVADAQAMKALAEAVLDFHGAAHLLVNNAGVTVASPFVQHSLEDWEWVMGVNLKGVVHGCHAFLPHMLAQKEGHIVNLSSLFGIVGVPMQTAYCATKFAVRGLSEALQEELEGSGVQVTVVHPGGINTRIIEDARVPDADAHRRLAGFFATKTLPARAAAAQIVAGVRQDRRRVLIGRETVVVDALKRLMPVAGNRLAIRALTRVMGIRGAGR